MEVLKWILAALGGASAVTLAIVLGISIIFRDTIAAWLTRRVAKNLERDADHYKHELAREMERYKAELASKQSAERLRAEMRKVVAEKMFALKLDAYHEVHDVLERVPHDFLANVGLPPEQRCTYSVVIQDMSKFADTVQRVSLYLPGEFQDSYLKLLRLMQNAATDEVIWTHTPPRTTTQPEMAAILLQTVRLLSDLMALHQRLPDDVADSLVRP